MTTSFLFEASSQGVSIFGGPIPRLLRRLTCGTSPDDGVHGHGETGALAPPPRLGASSGPAIAGYPLHGATRTPDEQADTLQAPSPGLCRGLCRLATHYTAHDVAHDQTQARHPRQQRGGKGSGESRRKASHPCRVVLYPSAHARSIHPLRARPETSPVLFTKPLKTQGAKIHKPWKQFQITPKAPHRAC